MDVTAGVLNLNLKTTNESEGKELRESRMLQTRSSDEKAVCVSVCQTRAL